MCIKRSYFMGIIFNQRYTSRTEKWNKTLIVSSMELGYETSQVFFLDPNILLFSIQLHYHTVVFFLKKLFLRKF